jgi:molecular chaperone HtpG
VVLEINLSHPIVEKLKSLYDTDRDALTTYAKILYAEGCLISGISLENPAELCLMITDLMTK